MVAGQKWGENISSHFFILATDSEYNGIANRNKAERNTMENRIWLYDYHLFEGGEGTGAEASTTATSTQAKEEKPKVEYGKAKGNDAARSQVGSDNGGQQSLDAEWKALTGKGGKYHDLYGAEVSKAIQDRFKNQADLQGQVDQITEDLSPLFMNYGLKSGDYEGLKNAIANDDAFYQAQAEREGIDVQQYKENLKLKAEAERGRQITEAYEEQMRQNEMFAQWEAEAAELQQAFPAFDLGLELESNERFAQMIYNGVPVHDAFLASHASEIFAGNTAYASAQATQNVINTIQQRAARPAEGAMHPGAAIVRKSDPSKLSDEDIDEINRRVANGEVISF